MLRRLFKKLILWVVVASVSGLALVGLLLSSQETTPSGTWSPTLMSALKALATVVAILLFLGICVVAISRGKNWKKMFGMGDVVGDNKVWLAIVIPSYILILIGIWQLLPSFWSWFGEHGWFFALWVIIGLPSIIAIVSTKQKFGWGLVLVWAIITLFAADWGRASTTLEKRFTPIASGAGTAGGWELCWEKHPQNVGINPAVQSFCSQLRSSNLEGQVMTIETIRKEGGGSSFIWDKKNPEGTWYHDLRQSEKGGSWGLTRVSDTLWAGYQTTEKGERATMTLRRK